MQATPALVEIDLNPVVVHGTGQGARALDALVAIAPEGWESRPEPSGSGRARASVEGP